MEAEGLQTPGMLSIAVHALRTHLSIHSVLSTTLKGDTLSILMPTIQLVPDTIYLEIALDPTG